MASRMEVALHSLAWSRRGALAASDAHLASSPRASPRQPAQARRRRRVASSALAKASPARTSVMLRRTAAVACGRQVKDDLREWRLHRVIWVLDIGFSSEANRVVAQAAARAGIRAVSDPVHRGCPQGACSTNSAILSRDRSLHARAYLCGNRLVLRFTRRRGHLVGLGLLLGKVLWFERRQIGRRLWDLGPRRARRGRRHVAVDAELRTAGFRLPARAPARASSCRLGHSVASFCSAAGTRAYARGPGCGGLDTEADPPLASPKVIDGFGYVLDELADPGRQCR